AATSRRASSSPASPASMSASMSVNAPPAGRPPARAAATRSSTAPRAVSTTPTAGASFRPMKVASFMVPSRGRCDKYRGMQQGKSIAATVEKPAAKISFVSLGCPKALVDSERIVTRLRAEGYELARAHAGADLVIVNTCGFLDSAQAESLSAIGAAMAENGRVIVTGCMGAEPEKITSVHPGVLAVTGPQQYESVLDAVHRAAPPLHDPYVDLIPPEGIKLTPRYYAYLKISEGCNNRCSFCIIPKLRGDLVSRPAADV